MRRTRETWTGAVLHRALVVCALVGLVGVAPAGAEAQETARQATGGIPPLVERPVPAPVVPPPFFRDALRAGTRSPDGSPGADYWRNSAVYDMDASLDPATGRLTGRVRIVYHNASPDTLPAVLLHLHQNIHAPGVVRNEPQEITGGVELRQVRAGGVDASPGVGSAPPFYHVEGTLMMVALPEPLVPGGEVELEIAWENVIPQSGAGRMGWSDREMYYLGYWFPKVAVYDDIRGWDAQPYQGGAEFYDEFGDYDVRLTVPEGWTVMATGELMNPQDVYPAMVRERLAAAALSDTIVPVVTPADLRGGRATVDGAGETLTYRFTADRVRDFAWTTSNAQRWDATSARVPDRDGDGAEDRVLIHAFWREDRAPLWEEQALYGKQSIEFHSRYTGFAYPWPHMTSVEGDDIIGGGMEFPMMTLIGAYRGQQPGGLFAVTSHELAHMWIPMIVGTNEKRYAWMDEGSTTFLEDQSKYEHQPGSDADADEMAGWLRVARAELEQPLMTHGDYYEPGPGYGVASYSKPASLLVTLRELLGEETFRRAYRTFVEEWAWKHPAPWDFFNTFERVSGRDLDWFWTSFYYETWTLDHAVAEVRQASGGEGPTVVVEDRGWAVMPARLVVETTEGGTLEREVPVTEWLQGKTRVAVTLPSSVGRITRVEVNPAPLVPEVDRSDNVWTSGG